MCTYWIILILTLIPTPTVPIYKFEYESMFDHYANHHIGTAVKVLWSLVHNSKCAEYQKMLSCLILKYAGYQKKSCKMHMSLHLPHYC